MNITSSILRTVKNNKLLCCVVLILSVFAIVLSQGTMRASAAFGDENWQGYFYGQQYTSGLQVLNNGVPSGVNDAASFINFVEGLYNSSNAQEHTAGAYIILSMLNRPNGTSKSTAGSLKGDWENLVNGYDDAGLIKFFWTTPSNFSCRNTFYQTQVADIADFSECAHTQNQSAIAFFNPNNRSQSVYVIRRACGNPIGNVTNVPQSWTLSGDSTVNGRRGTINKLPGATVTFSHGVTNNGPARASYTWTVQEQTNGGSWTNGGLPSRSPSNVGVNKSFPDISTYSSTYPSAAQYTIPGNAQPGFKYCQRIRYTNATGPNTGNDNSAPVCVTVPSGGGNPAAQCTSITIYDDGGYNVPGGNSNPRPTRTHVRVFGFNPNGGSPPSPYYGTSPGIDTVANTNPIANGDHRTWDSLTPTSSVIYIQRIRQYKTTNGVWITYNGGSGTSNTSGTLQAIPCYSAACSISVDSQIPGDPNGVKAGQQFTVNYTVWNNGPGGDPTTITGHQFSLNNGDVNGNGSYWGFSQPLYGLNQWGVESDSFTLTAPNTVTAQPLVAHPAYSNLFAIAGAQCGITVNVYQQFNIVPSAGAPTGDPEDPTTITYTTSGTNQGPAGPVNASSSSWLTIQSSGATVDGPHPGSHSYGTASDGPFTYNPPTIQAGDTYCSHITINPATGWLGPGGIAPGSQPATADSGSCLRVVNEPYFKVIGSGAAADATVAKPNNICSAAPPGSGLLAGWNDNTDDGTGAVQERGAGSQLSALALIKISGFASAQTYFTRSPTDLTFANTGSITSDHNAPDLGGNFGGQQGCITPSGAPSTAVNNGAANITAGSGTYTHTGDLIINGNTSVSGNTSITVNGSVYISGDITYANPAGFSAGSVPSFVLTAAGNIYIGPNVTRLDGLYIARPNSSNNKGNIYTCGDPVAFFSPMAAGSLYGSCNNQLLVYGSFIANQVRMMRTFGSLRDEKPTAGTPPGTQLGLTWTSAGPPTNPLPGGVNCTYINEPSDPGTWGDNWLCLPSTLPGGGAQTLSLRWTHYYNSPYADPNKDPGKSDPGMLNESYWVSQGYKYCTKWDVSSEDPDTWGDNELCMNQKRADGSPLLQFSKTNDSSQYCTAIRETADSDGSWAGTGYFLCEPKAAAGTSGGPPSPLICSHPGIQVFSRTCAAEIFYVSPELYLSDPNVLPPSNGATQWDAINSLPPVL